MIYEHAERMDELVAMGAHELARMVIRLEQDADAHQMSEKIQAARKTHRRVSIMAYYPQFDSDRPVTPAESFGDGDQEAMASFIAWLTEQPDTIEQIIDAHRDTRVVKRAVKAWSEKCQRGEL